MTIGSGPFSAALAPLAVLAAAAAEATFVPALSPASSFLPFFLPSCSARGGRMPCVTGRMMLASPWLTSGSSVTLGSLRMRSGIGACSWGILSSAISTTAIMSPPMCRSE